MRERRLRDPGKAIWGALVTCPKGPNRRVAISRRHPARVLVVWRGWGGVKPVRSEERGRSAPSRRVLGKP